MKLLEQLKESKKKKQLEEDFLENQFWDKLERQIGKTEESEENLQSKETKETSEITKIEKRSKKEKTREECRQIIKENCEQILEADRRIENAKIEYQVVTEYLADVQKIDMLPAQGREVLEDTVRKIATLTRERSKYQNSQMRTSNSRFRGIQRYEKNITQEFKRIREEEEYSRLVKGDMRQLEAEKASLFYEKKEIIEKQEFLKKLAWVTILLVGSLFVLFLTIAVGTKNDMMLPFIMTVAMAAVCAAYIFLESRKNHMRMVIMEKKLNKAIGLLNKVKIKCVNSTSTLDYGYSKFNVKDSAELQYVWDQYIKIKEIEKTYESNTNQLNYYREILMKELEKLSITDTEMWFYQATAIIDSKEMEEVRQKLNIRRQKLREQIDYNIKLKDESFEELHTILKNRPEMKTEILALFEKYEIEI